MKLDKKFVGPITKVKDNTLVPDDQWICFLAKDNAFAAILPVYLEECIQRKCDEDHVEAVENLIRNVNQWRKTNPELCKDPDAAGERLLP